MKRHAEIIRIRLIAARVFVREMSRDVLAEKSMLRLETIKMYENGKHTIKHIERVEEMADALGVPYGWLIGAVEAEEGSELEKAERLTKKLLSEGIQPGLKPGQKKKYGAESLPD